MHGHPPCGGRGDVGEGSHGLLDSGKQLDWLLRGQEPVRLEMAGSGEGLGGRPTAVGAASVAARLEDAHCTGDVERPRAQRSSSGSQPAFVLHHARPCTMGPRMA